MYACESWTIKKAEHQRIDAFEVLEKTLESPLDCREIQPVHPKGDQSWVFIGRIDVEAETLIPWLPDMKSWLIGKDPDAGKDWGLEEKWMTEDEMVGWYHRLNGHEFGWTPGVGDRQGGLVCCSSWGCKELDTTEQLNWTLKTHYLSKFQVHNRILLTIVIMIYIILLQDLFILFVGFSRQEPWSGLPFPSPVDHILSDKKKKGMTEDEMVGWHHRLNGCEFE